MVLYPNLLVFSKLVRLTKVVSLTYTHPFKGLSVNSFANISSHLRGSSDKVEKGSTIYKAVFDHRFGHPFSREDNAIGQ